MRIPSEERRRILKILDDATTIEHDVFSTKVSSSYGKASDTYIDLNYFTFDMQDANMSVHNLSKPLGYVCVKGTDIKRDHIFEDFLDSLKIGFYELDAQSNVINVNDYFARILGYSKEELLEQYCHIESLLVDMPSSHNIMRNQLLSKSWQGIVSLQSKSGEAVAALLSQSKSNVGLERRIYGNIIRIDNELLYTKSQYSNEEFIRYSFKCLLSNAQDATVLLDRSGKVLLANKSAELLCKQKLLKKKFVSIFSQQDEEKIDKMIKAVINGTAESQSIMNVRIENLENRFKIAMERVLGLEFENFGVTIKILDMTSQNEMEEALSHSQRMQTIGYLTGSIAHDFNNLLTTILGFCEILFNRHNEGDPSFSSLVEIRKSAHRAANLVKRLLAFSRKQTLQPEIIDIHEMFSEFNGILHRLLGKHITLKQKIENDVWCVKADRTQIEQVILNIVVNAKQAMGDSGTLSMKVYNKNFQDKDLLLLELAEFIAPSGDKRQDNGEYVGIEIHNDGGGIKKNHLSKIFEPFFTTNQSKINTGMGLSTAHGIVKQSCGYIYVKSTENDGVTFLVYLKRHSVTQEEMLMLSQINNKQNSIDVDFGAGDILLVEDEPGVAMFVKKALVDKGYNVTSFSNPEEALAYVNSGKVKFDLLITDVVMPEMNGISLAKEIKKKSPHIKIIFMSGYGEEAFEKEYGQDRNFKFLQKPFSLKEFTMFVREVLYTPKKSG